MNKDYLIHYGVLGMRWGHRKDRYNGLSKQDYKQRKKIDKAFRKDTRARWRGLRVGSRGTEYRSKVLKDFGNEVAKSKKISDTWDEAHKAYKSGNMKLYDKKNKVYQKTLDEIRNKYQKPYVEAFIKDYRLTKVSDINKKYISDKLKEQG